MHSEVQDDFRGKKDNGSIDDDVHDEYDEPISSDDNISDEAKDVPVKGKVTQAGKNQ